MKKARYRQYILYDFMTFKKLINGDQVVRAGGWRGGY